MSTKKKRFLKITIGRYNDTTNFSTSVSNLETSVSNCISSVTAMSTATGGGDYPSSTSSQRYILDNTYYRGINLGTVSNETEYYNMIQSYKSANYCYDIFIGDYFTIKTDIIKIKYTLLYKYTSDIYIFGTTAYGGGTEIVVNNENLYTSNYGSTYNKAGDFNTSVYYYGCRAVTDNLPSIKYMATLNYRGFGPISTYTKSPYNYQWEGMVTTCASSQSTLKFIPYRIENITNTRYGIQNDVSISRLSWSTGPLYQKAFPYFYLFQKGPFYEDVGQITGSIASYDSTYGYYYITFSSNRIGRISGYGGSGSTGMLNGYSVFMMT